MEQKIATGGTSRTTMPKFSVRAAAPACSTAVRHIGHCASAPAGWSAASAASESAARSRQESFISSCFIFTTSFRLARRGGGSRSVRALAERAEAVGEDYEEEADADDERRDEREHEAHALELEVHEVGDDQSGLDEREAHQDRQEDAQIVNLDVGQDDFDERQGEQRQKDVAEEARAALEGYVLGGARRGHFVGYGERVYAARAHRQLRDGDEGERQQKADRGEEEAVNRQEVPRARRVLAREHEEARRQQDADAHQNQVRLLKHVAERWLSHSASFERDKFKVASSRFKVKCSGLQL